MFLIELTPETATAVKIAWTAGIVIALIVTLIDVSLLLRVIRAARKINSLAGRTLPAAVGIVGNTSALANLGATNDVAAALLTLHHRVCLLREHERRGEVERDDPRGEAR